MRASRIGLPKSEGDDPVTQMSQWLEEYKDIAEKREAENFQLKLQIAQLCDAIKQLERRETAQEAYVVELEETVKTLGDECEGAQQQLALKDNELSRLKTLLYSNSSLTAQELRGSGGSGDEVEGLLAEALALHEESAQQQQVIQKLHAKLNDKESFCLDLRAQIVELELTLRQHNIEFASSQHRTHPSGGGDITHTTHYDNKNNISSHCTSNTMGSDNTGDSSSSNLNSRSSSAHRPEDSTRDMATLAISMSPQHPRGTHKQRYRRPVSESEDEPPSPSLPLKISRDLSRQLHAVNKRDSKDIPLLSYP
ncbi:hypothetical protein EON64_15935, partial [archaeon]